MTVLNNVDTYRHGGALVDRLYLGGDLLWQAGSIEWSKTFESSLVSWDQSGPSLQTLATRDTTPVMRVTVDTASGSSGYGLYGRSALSSLGVTETRDSLWTRYLLWVPSTGPLNDLDSSSGDTKFSGVGGIKAGQNVNDMADGANKITNGNWSARVQGRTPKTSWWGTNRQAGPFPEAYIYAASIDGVAWGSHSRNGNYGFGFDLRALAGDNSPLFFDTDAYNTLEIEVVQNTPGNADGDVRYWLNGVLGFVSTAVRWSTDDAKRHVLSGETFSNGAVTPSVAYDYRSYELSASRAIVSPPTPPPSGGAVTYGNLPGVSIGAGPGATTMSGKVTPTNGQTFENVIFTSPASWNVEGTASNVTLRNCTFQGDPSIEHVGVSGSGWLVENCLFEGQPNNHAVKVRGSRENYYPGKSGSVKIRNSRFAGTPLEDHVQFQGQHGGATENVIEYCEFPGVSTEDAVDLKNGDQIIIRYNLFESDGSGEGLLVQNKTNPTVVYDNRFVNVFHSFGAHPETGPVSDGVCRRNLFEGTSTLRIRSSANLLVEDNTFGESSTILAGLSGDDDPSGAYFRDNELGSGTTVTDNTPFTCYATGNSYQSSKFGWCSPNVPSWYAAIGYTALYTPGY